MRGVALFLIAWTAIGCSNDRCKNGSVLITVSLTGGAESADFIDVQLSVNGGPSQLQTVTHQAGSSAGSIEADFSKGYPTGQSLAFTVVARSDAQIIATETEAVTAGARCDVLVFSLDGSVLTVGDIGSADDISDGNAVDLSMADLTPPPPLCELVTVSTFAGNGTAGFVDGSGGPTGTAEFRRPEGVAVDSNGNVYVADSGNMRIRKVAANGTTTTLAGNGTQGFVDGTGGPTGTTEFRQPIDVAVDATGTVYVADAFSQRIRVVAPNGSTTTLAGNGTAGFVDGTGGPTGTTEFGFVNGIAVDGAGIVYVGDSNNNRIRRIALDGSTTTLTGNGTAGFFDGTGAATGTTEFNYPYGVAVGPGGILYVSDDTNNRIRRVAAGGSTTTLAGNGSAGTSNGTGTTAEFKFPTGIAVDGNGNVFVTDANGFDIRRIAPDGTTTTVAGTGASGYVEGKGCVAQFASPNSIAILGKVLFVADQGNNRIRQIQLP